VFRNYACINSLKKTYEGSINYVKSIEFPGTHEKKIKVNDNVVSFEDYRKRMEKQERSVFEKITRNTKNIREKVFDLSAKISERSLELRTNKLVRKREKILRKGEDDSQRYINSFGRREFLAKVGAASLLFIFGSPLIGTFSNVSGRGLEYTMDNSLRYDVKKMIGKIENDFIQKKRYNTAFQNTQKFMNLIKEEKGTLDVNLARALVMWESNGIPDLCSWAKACGLTQIIPEMCVVQTLSDIIFHFSSTHC